jgi:hypothetical protein
MDEQRISNRRRTLKEGRVILSDSTLLDCTIRDMSEGGARIQFGGLTNLPREFRLLLVSSNTVVPVGLAWQRGEFAGVYFTGPEEPAPARTRRKPGT